MILLYESKLYLLAALQKICAKKAIQNRAYNCWQVSKYVSHSLNPVAIWTLNKIITLITITVLLQYYQKVIEELGCLILLKNL